MPKWNNLVPFGQRGELQHYPSCWYTSPGNPTGPTWVKNYEFTATLAFTGFERGRSAAYAYFEDEAGKRYCMFLTNLADVIPRMSAGHISGTWTFCKRGQNFGIRLVTE
jgi:hypothetical protein